MTLKPVPCALLAVLAVTATAADAPLAEAARSGRSIRALLSDGADVNAALPDGTTALHWVVQANDLDAAAALIARGADVNHANVNGVTPLELAAINGSAAMIAKLLEAGADANAANPNGQTVLMFAARTGVPEALEALIRGGAQVNAKDSPGQQSALMWAVLENHPGAVRVLLDHGAEVDAATMLDLKPDKTVGNLQGLARAQNRAVPVPQGNLTALFYAARVGSLPIARMLIAAGADVNHREAFGATPLILAVTNGYPELARYLLDHGADPNLLDGYGRGPLWSAVDIRNLDTADSGENGIEDRGVWLELIRTLLEKGADPNAATLREPPSRRFMMPFGARRWVVPAGETPFIRAAQASDVTVMRLLLEHGADPNHVTKPGLTALMAAAGIGWVPRQTYTEGLDSTIAAIQLCLENGADVNAKSQEGYTAIHGAAFRGLDPVIQILADHGADLNVKDRRGRTPAGLVDGTQYLGGTPSDRRDSTLALLRKLGATSEAPPQ